MCLAVNLNWKNSDADRRLIKIQIRRSIFHSVSFPDDISLAMFQPRKETKKRTGGSITWVLFDDHTTVHVPRSM